MDYRKLATLCAASAMCLVIVALAIRLWSNSKRHTLPALVTVHVAADGRVFVPLGKMLYIESTAGDSLQAVPAKRFGLDRIDRDFAVLDDDTILLQAGEPSASSFTEDLQRYERLPDRTTDNSPGTIALQRCSLGTDQCTRLEGEGDHYRFRQSFRLAVDQSAGRIYVADTGRQRLLILNMHGKVLAAKTSGVWFPNGIRLAGKNRIEVADTNDHRAVTIAVANDRFGRDISQVRLEIPGRQWPFGVARSQGGTLWAVIADNNMGHGVLVRWPETAKRAQPLTLPAGAEPAYPEVLPDGSLLVPDSSLYRIYRFAPDGSELPDFGSKLLKSRLHALAGQSQLFNALFHYGWIIIAVLAAPLLHLTFYFQRLAGTVAKGRSYSFDAEEMRGESPKVAPAAWRATEYVFRKRLAATGSRSSRLVAWMLIIIVVLMTAILYFLLRSPGHPVHHADGEMSFEQGQLWFVGILALVYVAYVLLSQKYERLRLNHTGIRYQTWLAGPLAMFAGLHPGWQLRWQEIVEIRLYCRGSGKLPMLWQFELHYGQNQVRRISALFWKLEAGNDDNGLTIWQLNKRNPDILRKAIGRTMLYRLLELSTRTASRRSL